jgi:hypothetical protein
MAYNPQNPNGQATMANSAPVVIASDQTAVPVSSATSASGGAIATAASISGQSSTLGRGGPGSAVVISSNPAQVYGWYFYNPNTIPAYIHFYNAAPSTPNTWPIGNTAPYYVLVVPPVAGANVFGIGIAHSVGITIGISQERNGPTILPVAIDYNIFFKA